MEPRSLARGSGGDLAKKRVSTEWTVGDSCTRRLLQVQGQSREEQNKGLEMEVFPTQALQ